MNPNGSPQKRPSNWARVALLVVGLFNTFVGAALLIAPAWFYAAIAPYPPFNRHLLGDLGAFILPLGAGLLIAARNPSRHRDLIAVGAGASFLHLANHLYDDALFSHWSVAHALMETLPLATLGVLLVLAYRGARENP